MTDAVRLFVPVAIRGILVRLDTRLRSTAGYPVEQIVDLNPAIARRIGAGEAFDVGLTNPPHVTALIAGGRVDGATHRAFGRVPLAIARRSGPQERILTETDGIAALLCRADSISYTEEGTSGRVYLETLRRLGLPESVTRNSHAMAAGGPVASVLAGTTELAVVPLTTILSHPGVVPAAIFPDGLGAHIDMSVFLSARCRPGAAAVLDLLVSRELDYLLAAAGVARFSFD